MLNHMRSLQYCAMLKTTQSLRNSIDRVELAYWVTFLVMMVPYFMYPTWSTSVWPNPLSF